MLRTYERVPETVTNETGAAALVAADRMGLFRVPDLTRVLSAVGYGRSERTVRRLVNQMARDGLVTAFGSGPARVWMVTSLGQAWASRVWTGKAPPRWTYHSRGMTRHRALLNELYAALAATLEGAPVLGLWRTHGRAAVGTYDVSYDLDARLDLDHVRLWIEVDRNTVRPYRLEAKMVRLRQVLTFRQFARSGYRRLLWVLEKRSPTRKAQVTELFCKWLNDLFEAPPDPSVAGIAPGSAFAGVAPAFEVWIGTAEEVLGRLKEEWPFWAARDGAVRPHVLAAERVRAALARVGYAAAVVEWQQPVLPWRVPVVQAEGRPALLVVDGRYSATLPAWAAMVERWAVEAPGKTYGLVLLASEKDAMFLAGRRVLWSTPELLEGEAGVRVAPRRGSSGGRVEWSRVLESTKVSRESKEAHVAGNKELKLPIPRTSYPQPRIS